MEISSRLARQTALFSLLLLIVPLVVFPHRFGGSVLKPSLIYAMYELVFYGAVVWLFSRRSALLPVVQAAGFCFVYRLALGVLFGLAIAVAYGMNVTVALTVGTSGYLPALLLHVAATPFVLRPLWQQLLPSREARRVRPLRAEPPGSSEIGRTSIAVSRDRGVRVASSIAPPPVRSEPAPSAVDASSRIPDAGGAGFERAVRYIGGDASVHMAAVIDREGLLLGQFSRRQIDCEAWAPFALTLLEVNQAVADRAHWGAPEKLRLEMADYRVIVAFERSFCLMVVAEWQVDDLLNIRINQGLEIIKKYAAERYGEKLYDNAERTNVPSA